MSAIPVDTNTKRRAWTRGADLLRNIDWLVVLIVSWILPLGLVPGIKVTYGYSLLFWLVPIVCLLPRFLRLTHPGSRRRRAMGWATAQIVFLGVILDFVFGHAILQFSPRELHAYVGYLPAIGMSIPIEEVLFYFLAPPAMLLVYFWLDEYWLVRYNKQELRLTMDERPILRASGGVVAMGLALEGLGIILKRHWDPGGTWLPYYFTYLVAVAFLPTVLLYRSVNELINWRALSVTVLYVIATSIIWEATLAIPNRWWGYKPEAIFGITVGPWTRSNLWPFPIEAGLVWIAGPFACILTYEAVKAYHYHPSKSKASRLLPHWAIGRHVRSEARL